MANPQFNTLPQAPSPWSITPSWGSGPVQPFATGSPDLMSGSGSSGGMSGLAGVGMALGGPWGAAAGAVGDIALGAISSRKAYKRQKRLLQMQQQFQREMNEWQWNKSLEMFDLENSYNSPDAQRKRFEQAGINPFVAFSNSIGGASSAAASGASPSLASSPSAPTPAAFEIGNGSVSSAFQNMAAGFEALDRAHKAGLEAKQLEETMTDYIKQFKANAEMSRLLTAIQRKFGFTKAGKELMEMAARTDMYDSQSKKNLADEYLSWAKTRNTEQEYEKVMSLIPLIQRQEEAKAKQEEEKVETQKAITTLTREQGKTERSVRALNDAQRKQVDAFTKHQNILNKYAGAKQMRELRTMSSSAKLQVVDRLLSYGVIEFTANGEVKLSASAEGGLRLPASAITANSKLAGELGVKAGAKGAVYLNEKQVQKLVDSAIEDVWYSDDYDD